ncbi:hypothetical protein BD289DRAFT_481063 [Coniella lustricola]|uniref:Uncharacterized protein n=1 Tax=Coniella lustricola TaxID=2025994 RepID=A0A2T3ADB4_9PEZI|nr:hypothetical protein BD289DRAFT_481063 [Coniella lustricola]
MSHAPIDNGWGGSSADSGALWGGESGEITTSATTPLEMDVSEPGNTSERQSRGRRLRKGDLEKLLEDRQSDEEKFVSVWHRAGRNKPLQLVLDKFPRNAAMTFSPVWKKQLEDGASSAVLVIEDEYLAPYKLLFKWINECVENGNDIKFPEFEDENAINTLFDVLVAANQVQIPEMSLQEHLKKRAIKHARKSLIGLDYVDAVFDENHSMYLGPSPALEEAVCASIFEAWWSRTLDAPDYQSYSVGVEELREMYPKLNDGLNECFESKKTYIEQKKTERKGQKGQRTAASSRANDDYGNEGSHENINDYGGYSNDGADGGWGSAADATIDTVGEWGAPDSEISAW